MKGNCPTFTLTVEVLHRWDDPDGWRRLRGLLKTALRGFGIKVTSIQPQAVEGEGDDHSGPYRKS